MNLQENNHEIFRICQNCGEETDVRKSIYCENCGEKINLKHLISWNYLSFYSKA